MSKLINIIRSIIRAVLRPFVIDIINHDRRIWGSSSRVRISHTAEINNTLLNTISGDIVIGEYTFCGHNVSLITGTHNYTEMLEKRMHNAPKVGRDIIIGNGVWIGTNAIILGPCTIGDHAVIAAGALVTSGSTISARTIVAGIPAKHVRNI